MAEGEAERDRLLALLDAAAAAGRRIPFWWRDDDAEDATPALERLLALAGSHRLPLAIAVVPKGATAALGARLAAAPGIAVLQHGFSHARHNPPGEKKAELGAHRPVEAMLAELSAGRARLEALFGARFLPVLVPPWNRASPALRARRAEAGLPVLSTFGPRRPEDRPAVNTHVDLIDWTVRRTKPHGLLFDLVRGEVERRLGGDDEPVGLLGHHLATDAAGWTTTDDLLGLLAGHPAVAWPAAAAMVAAA